MMRLEMRGPTDNFDRTAKRPLEERVVGKTVALIQVSQHRDRRGRLNWYSAVATFASDPYGDLRCAVVVHTPNRRVIARELAERWSVRVPLRQVSWHEKLHDCSPGRGDPDEWCMLTTMQLWVETK